MPSLNSAASAPAHSAIWRDSERDGQLVMTWMSNSANERFFFNRRWLEFTGQSLEHELRSGWLDAVHPDDRESCLVTYEDAQRCRDRFRLEYRLRRHSSDYRWFLEEGTPWHSSGGAFSGHIGLCVDITEQKEALRAQVESGAFIQSVLNSLPMEIIVLDRHGVIIAVNSPWDQFGIDNGIACVAKIAPGMNYLNVCRQNERPFFGDSKHAREAIGAVLNGGATGLPLEYACHTSSSHRWFLMHASPLRWAGGGAVISHLDITGRKLAENALRESDIRLRLVLDSLYIGAFDWELQTGEVSCDVSVYEHFDLDPTQRFRVEAFFDKMHAIDLPRVKNALDEAFSRRPDPSLQERDPPIHIEFRISRSDGSIGWLVGNGAVVRDQSSAPVRLIGLIYDITDRKTLQEKLLTIAEEERRRIGRDLHDDVGQELTGISLMTQALEDDFREGRPHDGALVENIRDRLAHIQGRIRALSRGLVPEDHEAQDLAVAIQDLTERMSMLYGLDCTFSSRGNAVVTKGTTVTHLYRIAQEAIANAIRHGRSPRIEVAVRNDDDGMVLEIADEGVGIADESERGDGLGLRSMRYRADLIGATLKVSRREPSGTRVTCKLSPGFDEPPSQPGGM